MYQGSRFGNGGGHSEVTYSSTGLLSDVHPWLCLGAVVLSLSVRSHSRCSSLARGGTKMRALAWRLGPAAAPQSGQGSRKLLCVTLTSACSHRSAIPGGGNACCNALFMLMAGIGLFFASCTGLWFNEVRKTFSPLATTWLPHAGRFSTRP